MCHLSLISDNLIFIPENINFIEGNYIISIPKFCTNLSPVWQTTSAHDIKLCGCQKSERNWWLVPNDSGQGNVWSSLFQVIVFWWVWWALLDFEFLLRHLLLILPENREVQSGPLNSSLTRLLDKWEKLNHLVPLSCYEAYISVLIVFKLFKNSFWMSLS